MEDPKDFEALLREFEQERAGSRKADPRVGDKVRGKVLSIGPDNLFVDLGGKSEGMMETTGFTDTDGNLTVAVGDQVEAIVASKDEETGTLLLGNQHGRHIHGIAELENAYRQRLPVEGRVSGTTKGGVEVQIAGQRAFCPASQLDLRYIEEMESFVGQRLEFRITKLEAGRHVNLVVSRRALLEEEQRALAEQTRAQLEVGAVLSGTVTTLKDYGAFVDLGGVEGMVHISELAFGHVKHPSEVLTTGQQVEVAVLRIEKTDNPRHPEKVSLSIRALAADPWQDASGRYPAGVRLKGTITRIQPFGAFVELEPGVEGLVHISELGSGRRVSHPQEVVSTGQEVEATVISVDMEKRRISLSLDTSKRGDEAAAGGNALRDYQAPKESLGTLGDLLRESMEKQKE